MERYCIAKEFTRADGTAAWGVYDDQNKVFVESGFFRKGAAQKVAAYMNAQPQEENRDAAAR